MTDETKISEGIEMRVTKVVAGLATVITAVLGLSLATAGSASAATSGSWRAFGNTNPITSSTSTWHCASTLTVDTSVLAQVCAIRSSGGGAVQGAVIVRNNRASLYSATAAMDLAPSSDITLGLWVCPSSGVGAHSWSVCFGQTLTESSPVNSVGDASGVVLGTSPFV